GANSFQEIFGKNVMELYPHPSSKAVLSNDTKVMRNKKMHFFEEEIRKEDEISFVGLSFKLPWYNTENRMIGIFGATVVIDNQYLGNPFALMSHLNLFKIPSLSDSCFYLTNRQMQILELTILGKSARLIGEILNLSKRTIETHLENIKNKLGVLTRH